MTPARGFQFCAGRARLYLGIWGEEAIQRQGRTKSGSGQPDLRSTLADRPGGALREREDQLYLLDTLVERASAGAGGLVLVEGQAGIGKTRLLAEARRRASGTGVRVLAAQGSELEAAFPFGVVRQLFEVSLTEPAIRDRWLAGSARAAAQVFESLGEADTGSHDDVSFAVLHGLYWLIVNAAADGPLMLTIDDIHWCDRASLRLVAYLMRRVEGLPVLVAVGLRTAERGVDAALLAEIARDPAAASIHLSPLSQMTVGHLVRERLGVEADHSFAAACHEATGGNPLLLHELLRALRAEGVVPDSSHATAIRALGPSAVSRTVLVRLVRLSADAIEVARAVAVLGDNAAVSAIAALTGRTELAVAQAARELIPAEILDPEPPLRFVHPLVRDAVYHELAPADRELRHAHAALVLRDSQAPPEQVAAHLLMVPGRNEAWAVDLLQAASRAAVRKGALDSAVSCLRRALAEPPPPDRRTQLLVELGMAESLISAPPAAEHLREALGGLQDPLARARTSGRLARMLIFIRPPEEAAAVAAHAAAELPPGPPDLADQRRALEAMELFAAGLGVAGSPDIRSRLVGARAPSEDGGPGAKMLTAVAAWDWALHGGTATDCVDLALRALGPAGFIAADPAFMTVVAAGVLVMADREEALDTLDAALAEAHRQGSLLALSSLHHWRGWAWLQQGELSEAQDSLRRAAEASTLLWHSGTAGDPYAAAFLARVLIARGDLTSAHTTLSRADRSFPRPHSESLWRRSRTELALAERRWKRAIEEADGYATHLGNIANPGWAPWRSLKAQALAPLGRLDEALALVEEELVWARRWGAPGALGRALRVQGSLRGDRGLEALREAAEVTAGSPARLEHAEAQFALGSALRQAHRPTDARQPLRLALDLALRCGAAPLAGRARAELRAAGARQGHSVLTGPQSLTPSERRVADLAAEGQSNRDIAQLLYVSPKTVEIHLSSTYRKLGIGSRAALRAALGSPP